MRALISLLILLNIYPLALSHDGRQFKTERDCQTNLTGSKLNTDQINALCSSAKFFDIVIFKSKNRTPDLILLGESHVMNKNAEFAGENLLNKFKLRALEGYNGEFHINSGAGIGYNFAMILAKIGLLGTSNIIRARNTGFYLWSDGEESQTYLNKKSHSPLKIRDVMWSENVTFPISINLERSKEIRQEIESHCKYASHCSGALFKQYMIERRNDDMSETLVGLKNTAFAHKSLLAIVGSDHVSGIAKRLKLKLDVSPKVISQFDRGQ